jgi:hypothetical protein
MFMRQRFASIAGVAVCISFMSTGGCSAPPPQRPTAVATTELDADALVDGATLKIAAPVLDAPADGAIRTPAQTVVLSVRHVRGRYADFPVSYEVQVSNSAGAVLYSTVAPQQGASQSGVTAFPIVDLLEANTPLNWRARARFGSSAGPWSVVRTLTVQRTVRLTLARPTLEVGTVSTGTVRVLQQGGTFNCSTPAIWTSSDVGTVAVTGDSVRGIALGDAQVRAECEGLVSAPAVVKVREIWRGRLIEEACEPKVGSARPFPPLNACRAGSYEVILELSQRAPTFVGEIFLGPFTLAGPATGIMAGSRVVSLTFHHFGCLTGNADNENIWYDLDVTDDRALISLGLGFSTQFGIPCADIEKAGPTWRWTVTGRLVLNR